MSVSMKPGATTLTVMLREPISRARDFEKPMMPAGQVRRDDVVPFLRLHPHQQVVARDAGVVDEYRRRALVARDVRQRRIHRLLVGNVEDDAAPTITERGRYPVGTRLAGRRSDHRRTRGGQCLGNAGADAARRARYQRDLPVEGVI